MNISVLLTRCGAIGGSMKSKIEQTNPFRCKLKANNVLPGIPFLLASTGGRRIKGKSQLVPTGLFRIEHGIMVMLTAVENRLPAGNDKTNPFRCKPMLPCKIHEIPDFLPSHHGRGDGGEGVFLERGSW